MPTALAAESLLSTAEIPLSTDEMVGAVFFNLDAVQFTEDGVAQYDDMWSYNEIVQWLNEGFSIYWQKLLQAGEGDGEATNYVDFSPQVDTYQLPADTLKVAQVERKGSDGTWIPCRYRRSPYQVAPDDMLPLQVTGDDVTYKITGGWKLVVNPTPQDNEYQALRVKRLVVPPPIMAGTGRPARDFLPVWVWMLILYATCCALDKDRADKTAFMTRLQKLEQVFMEFLEQRSQDIEESVSFSEALGFGEMF